MASTYTTGFGIEKIGTGEQAGAWGTTTNHNADILDRIASYTAVALSGATHTLTVREASPGSGTENLQDGMYRVIKFTGALGANNTVTIAPNTSPVWFIIENATTDSGSSGPYSVILTQGSGANVTVQNGKNAVIYCDGAGAGAAVYDALADLQVGTLEVTGAIAAASLTLTTDLAIADGGTGASTASAARAALDVDPAGTDNSTNVTLAGTPDYITISGQTITRGAIVLTTDVSGILPIANGGTNASSAGAALTALGAAASGANSDITSITGLTTDLTVAQGGTGAGTFAANGILYGNGTGAIAATAVGTAAQVLTSNGAGVAPTFQAIPAASDTVAGIAELSTDAETITGIDTGRVTTPANIAAKMTAPGAIGGTTPAAASFTTISATGNITLGDAANINMSVPLLAGADHTFTGLSAQMLAGGTIAAFELVCVHTITQEVVTADASAYATARVIGIAPAAISDTATGTVLLHGFIRDDTWAWTTGSTLYLSETAGAMTHTPPSTDGAFVQVVGVALSPDVVYMNPSMDVIERA